jgi:hypothetical protein
MPTMKATSNRLRAMAEHSQPFRLPSPPGNPQSKIFPKKVEANHPKKSPLIDEGRHSPSRPARSGAMT